jgi:hypothetical protein
MTGVVPSQVVDFIDTILSAAKNTPADGIRVGSEYALQFLAVVSLVGDIPSKLLQVGGADYAPHPKTR